MKKLLRRALIAVAGLLFLTASAVRAQDESLKIIPGNSPIVVQVNGLEKAQGNLNKFLSNALPDLAPMAAAKIKEGMEELFKNRDLKAIDKNGRILLAVTDLENLMKSPSLGVLIPVSDYKSFKDSFLKEDERKSLKDEGDGIESAKFEDADQTVYLASQKKYVVIATEKDVAKLFTAGMGLDKTMSKETAKSFLGQDLAIYVNIKEINNKYGAQIRIGKTLVDQLLQNQGGMGLEKKQIEAAKVMINAAIGILEDGEAFVLGVEFRPEGINLHVSTQFSAASETNQVLKKFKPTPLSEIGTLPDGQVMYSGSTFNPWASKTMAALIETQLAGDDDPAIQAEIKKCFQEMAENGRVVEVGAMSGGQGSLEVTQYKDAAKALNSQMTLFKVMSKSGSIGGLPLKEKPSIKENAETVGDIKFTNVKMAIDVDKATASLPGGASEALKKLIENTSSIWIGRKGDKVIQVAAKDFSMAKSTIEDYLAGRKTLSSDAGFTATRKQLPADATILFIGDTANLVEMGFSLIKDQLANVPGFPGGGNLPALKAPKGKPAYSGIAMTFKPEYATIDTFVPVAAVQQVRKMLAPLINGDN